MANWNDIKTNVSHAASKTIRVAGELADIAKLNIKVKTLTVKLSGKFEKLGRLTYKQLKVETSYAEEIAVIIADIDQLRADIKELKEKIEIAKAEREAAKRAEADACNTEE
jgi:septal ring factor EnvC (AmiA/AmiB activator)